MNALIIREMIEADIQAVAAIEQMSFTMPWSETSFFNELYNQHSIAMVAATKERIIGYICAKYVAGEGHILNLAVHPDFRKKGIAKELVENAIEHLKKSGCRFLYLEVRASNDAARKLYEGFGFKVVGIRKNYYTKPEENAAIMMLKSEMSGLDLIQEG